MRAATHGVLCFVVLFLAGSALAQLRDSDRAETGDLPVRASEGAGLSHVSKLGPKLPLSFVENKGQLDDRVRFQARSPRATVYFTPGEVVFHFVEVGRQQDGGEKPVALRTSAGRRDGGLTSEGRWPRNEKPGKALVLRVSFVGAKPSALVEGCKQLPGKVNVLNGNDASKWLRDIPTYGEIVYRDLWPGIDLVYRGEPGCGLKYDVVVGPGADPGVIRLRYKGHDQLRVNAAGELVVETALGPVTEKAPCIYQDVGGTRVEVEGAFEVIGADTVRYRLGAFDTSHPLIIDPGLVYSTFLGGSDHDVGNGIAVDGDGNAYVTGNTSSSSDFPTTAGAYDTSHNGGQDVFVTKLNAAGSGLVYSTFLGSYGSDYGQDIAVDSSGNAYVVGTTESPYFPTTPGAYDSSLGGVMDVFVTKLNAAGSDLVYSTFVGRSGYDHGHGIALDGYGQAYVTGQTLSNDFPTTTGAYDTSYNDLAEVFVTKLNIAGSGLVYSTFLGGSGADTGYGIAVDIIRNAYVTGDTTSTDFPTTAGAYDTSHNGGSDVFVTKLNPAGSSLDRVSAIAVHRSAGQAYVTGYTASSDFPTTAGAYDTSHNGGTDVFATRLKADGSVLWYSTFLGGNGNDFGDGIAMDASATAYITGTTRSADFPTTPDAYDTSYKGGDSDAFVVKLYSLGLVYSTFLGGSEDDGGSGIAVDGDGNAYVTGDTKSIGFPRTAGAYDTTYNGGDLDVFVLKLHDAPDDIKDVSWDETVESVVIVFASELGVGYKLERVDADQYADDLIWTSLPADTLTGAADDDMFVDDLTVNPLTAAFRFYRVARISGGNTSRQTAGVFELDLAIQWTMWDFFISTALVPDADHASVQDVLSTQIDRSGPIVTRLVPDTGLQQQMQYDQGTQTWSVLWGSAFEIEPGRGYYLSCGGGVEETLPLRLTGYVPDGALSIDVSKPSWTSEDRWLGYSMPRPMTLETCGLRQSVSDWTDDNRVELRPHGSGLWSTYGYDSGGEYWYNLMNPGVAVDPALPCGSAIKFTRKGMPPPYGPEDYWLEATWYAHPPNEW